MFEVLKKLYGDAVTEESLGRFNEELGKKFVPRTEFNQKGEEVKMLREQVATGEQELETLRLAVQEKVALEEELETLQQKHEAELSALRKEEEKKCFEEALNRGLEAAKARSLPAVKALLNREELVYENGTLLGLKEQLETLKKEQGYLFEAEAGNIQFVRPASSAPADLTQEEFQKMGYMERLKLKKEKPELYQTMMQNNRR